MKDDGKNKYVRSGTLVPLRRDTDAEIEKAKEQVNLLNQAIISHINEVSLPSYDLMPHEITMNLVGIGVGLMRTYCFPPGTSEAEIQEGITKVVRYACEENLMASKISEGIDDDTFDDVPEGQYTTHKPMTPEEWESRKAKVLDELESSGGGLGSAVVDKLSGITAKEMEEMSEEDLINLLDEAISDVDMKKAN